MIQQQLALQQTAPVAQQYPIPTAPQSLQVGRTPDNQIVLDEDAVSRHHASIWDQGGQAFIRDEQSTNGTFVDGQLVRAQVPFPLHPGSEIRIGSATFTVAVSAQPLPEEQVAVPSSGVRQSPAIWIIAGAAGLAVVLLLIVFWLASQRPYSATPRPQPPTASPQGVTPTVTALAPTIAPTVPPTASSGKVGPVLPVTPTLPATQSLRDALQRVRQSIQAFGSEIDRAGGNRPDCAAIVADYEAIAAAPVLSPPQDRADLANLHAEYRKGISLFLGGGRDLYQNCKQFLLTKTGDFSGLQLGQAYQGVQDALGILDPVADQAGKLP